MEYTIEIYKKDRRRLSGERLVKVLDVDLTSPLAAVEAHYRAVFKDHRIAVFETWVTRKNLMGGGEFKERYDTPHYCSPSSESYWSM